MALTADGAALTTQDVESRLRPMNLPISFTAIFVSIATFDAAQQTDQVDLVSGATDSSDAYAQAVATRLSIGA